MSDDPFNKYYLCNFNGDLLSNKDYDEVPEVSRLWMHEWETKDFDVILNFWISNEANSHVPAVCSQLLCDAAALTFIFMQYNFTGPFDKEEELNEWIKKNETVLKSSKVEEILKVNSEEINPNVKFPEIFVLAKYAIERLCEFYPNSVIVHWWRLRHIWIHQQILGDLTDNLYRELERLSKFLLDKINTLPDKECIALLYLELVNSYLVFHRSQKADQLLDDLCKVMDVELILEGLMGLRTKFQQKALPQLCLKVQRTDGVFLPPADFTNPNICLPKLLLLEDDTRLERIRFVEPTDNDVMTLPSVLQILVLAKVKQLQRSQPDCRLRIEELEPYIHTLLYQEKGPFQVRQSALLLNCQQESNQRRTVERAWKQCGEAVKHLSSEEYSLSDRFSYCFASFLRPIWEVELQLCNHMRSLGLTKSALAIYEKIQAWEEVIDCYNSLELRHKAAEIIKLELDKKKTVRLYCMLGDATDTPTYYSDAWILSNYTSGKAQAHWGTYFFRNNDYEAAIPHLELSVKINPLQEKIWLRLGYAAIILERWDLAVHAYITYTHLDPQNFEAWNNLAKALIKLGDKMRAHKILGEALKCNFNNWKIWENFLLVAVDTLHFDDAMNAYNRLVKLKERYIDLEVLNVVVNGIIAGKEDAKGQPRDRLLKKARELIAVQCTTHGSEGKLWELASLVATTSLDKSYKLVKAFTANTNIKSNWTMDKEKSVNLLKMCIRICELSLDANVNRESDISDGMVMSQLQSARLTGEAYIRAMDRNKQTYEETDELLPTLKELIARVLSEALKLSS